MSAPQGTPEWLQERAGKVTASGISNVIAKGRGNEPSATRAKYMGQLIAETLTGQPAKTFTNAAMDHGIEHEPMARARYEIAFGVMVEQVGLILHPKIDRAGASPDGLVDEEGLLEIKCPETHTHIEYLLANTVPTVYRPQMAWQCACTGRKWVDFVSFDPRMPEELQLFAVRYVPDEKYLSELEGAVIGFLAEMDMKLEELRKVAA